MIQIRPKQNQPNKWLTCASQPNPTWKNPLLQIIPTASTLLCTNTAEVGRKGRRRKLMLEQMHHLSLSQMTEKFISCFFLPVSQNISRCCRRTSQHLIQTTSKLNLCKGKKSLFSCSSLSLSCFRVIV